MRRCVFTLVFVTIKVTISHAEDPVRVTVPPGALPGPYECRPAPALPSRTAPPGLGLDANIPEGERAKGVELIVRASYAFVEPQSPVRYASAPGGSFATDPGQLYDGSVAPYRGGIQLNAGTGYRFSHRFSAGLGGSFTKLLSASIFQDGTQNLVRLALSIAPYVRFYVAVGKHIEFWGALGAGFKQDVQTFDKATTAKGQTQSGKWTMTHEGIAVPVGFGVDFNVAGKFFLGPSVQYLGVVATGGCLKIDAPNLQKQWCTYDSPSVTRAFSYQQLTAGVSARLRF